MQRTLSPALRSHTSRPREAEGRRAKGNLRAGKPPMAPATLSLWRQEPLRRLHRESSRDEAALLAGTERLKTLSFSER